jgi:hypothetical protein
LSLALFLAALPALYWPAPVATAAAVRQAGIERLLVPPDEVDAWRAAGVSAEPLSAAVRAARVPLDEPGLLVQPDGASVTVRPWVVANGWQFRRDPSRRYRYDDLPAGKAALAAAEAFAHGADAVLSIDPADLADAGRILRFLGTVPEVDLPEVADVAVVDDGSPLVGEVLRLLARHNLLFRTVRAPVPDARLNVELGTKEFPREDAADPDAFALAVRRRLTDARRSVRIFGSEVVLVRPEADARRARLHLLNYGGRPIAGLRVRLEGRWETGSALGDGVGRMRLEDWSPGDGATEFTVPELVTYAVVDLEASR